MICCMGMGYIMTGGNVLYWQLCYKYCLVPQLILFWSVGMGGLIISSHGVQGWIEMECRGWLGRIFDCISILYCL
ncbi:hypothetical protein F383_12039 [Gossypium arboreum]|uniref:Uncharacterized protein n=1 Tax=Gossypium arboreum TaxID=29729 RepID=A0A0B0PV97_GOSAR|nr:hypothetical protein F383_12039 [Gossypium arboreum]